MQFRYVLFLSAIAFMLALACAAREEIVFNAEEPTRSLVRKKRFLHAKKALLIGGGALLGAKALLAAGLIGAGLHKAKTERNNCRTCGHGPEYGYSHGHENGDWSSGSGGYYVPELRYYPAGCFRSLSC